MGHAPDDEVIADYLADANPYPDETEVDLFDPASGEWQPAVIVERTDTNEWTVEFAAGDDGWRWADHTEIRFRQPIGATVKTTSAEPAHDGSAGTWWDRYWADIANEEMLAAKALIELSPAVRRDAVAMARRPRRSPRPPALDRGRRAARHVVQHRTSPVRAGVRPGRRPAH